MQDRCTERQKTDIQKDKKNRHTIRQKDRKIQRQEYRNTNIQKYRNNTETGCKTKILKDKTKWKDRQTKRQNKIKRLKD